MAPKQNTRTLLQITHKRRNVESDESRSFHKIQNIWAYSTKRRGPPNKKNISDQRLIRNRPSGNWKQGTPRQKMNREKKCKTEDSRTYRIDKKYITIANERWNQMI